MSKEEKHDPFARPEFKDNPYMNDKGILFTSSLFYDITGNKEVAVYVIGDKDKQVGPKVYKSLKRLYLDMEDVTEYEFAHKYLDGWKHWNKLLASPLIRKNIEEWRAELALKLRARGLRSVIRQASTEEKLSFQAAKYLADKGWIDVDNRTKRNNSKDKKEREVLSSEFQDDFERMSKLIN